MTTLLTAKINTVLGSQSNHSYKAKEQSGLYEFQCGVILQFELTLKVHKLFFFFPPAETHLLWARQAAQPSPFETNVTLFGDKQKRLTKEALEYFSLKSAICG